VKLPNLASRAFAERKYEVYARLREEAPVCHGRIAVLRVALISRYDDCIAMLKDPRFVRNRTTATGGRRMPIPMPRSVALMAQSMIVEDDPAHRRLRGLVSKAFTPRAVARLEPRIERLTHELLDAAEKQGTVDLMPAYALPIPVTVIGELVGVSARDMPRFQHSLRAVTTGLSSWSLLRTLFVDLPASVTFVRELIARKRAEPQDDLLTALLQAEEAGDRLSEDELVGMVFLLLVAGYETTVHLITNAVAALLQHPEQLARLRAEPGLLDAAVEEVLRYRGPVQATKPGFALEDVTLHGVTIRKGTPTIPLLAAANHDPAVFPSPEAFDVGRTPNHHLGFGHGAHFCLGAQLARLETRIALRSLLERSPRLRLAVPPETLRVRNVPLWHRHASLPVTLA
jgi:cytochrome P450